MGEGSFFNTGEVLAYRIGYVHARLLKETHWDPEEVVLLEPNHDDCHVTFALKFKDFEFKEPVSKSLLLETELHALNGFVQRLAGRWSVIRRALEKTK